MKDLSVSDERKELEELVRKAKLLLAEKDADKDVRAYAALLDMTEKAEAALGGKKFPFTCRREFWKREEEDEINFYLQHKTKAPSFYKIPGIQSEDYGLKTMLEWYQNRDKYSSDDPCNVRLQLIKTDNGNFLLSNAEIDEIRDKIKKDPVFSDLYIKIKKISDKATLEQRREWYRMNCEGVDYSVLREQFDLWRNCGYGANFSVPDDTKKVSVTITLPSCENMENGLGHIWLKNMYLKSSNGDFVYINLGENNELYLRNETNDVSATYQAGEYDIIGGMIYTISFDAIQEGKFKEGLHILVTSYDSEGKEIDRYTYLYNKKTWLQTGSSLAMQCDAIVYMISRDKTYAEKAKINILHFLDDFCQGAYHWMVYGSRPDCFDSYGAVQAGRVLCSVASSYTMIEDAQIFSEEEKKLLYDLVDFLLLFVLDLRDRTRMSFDKVQVGSGNWQTDMCIGAAMVMFAIKDFPNREMWIDNAYAVVYGQLLAHLNPDGSWPESIRYHHAVLTRLTAFAKVLKRNVGIDWFRDTDLKKMFCYGVDVQTPAYEYFDNCISTPTFGDHKLSAGEDFSLYGLYLNEIKEVDPVLADKMYLTYVAAGRPSPVIKGENMVVLNFLCPSDYQTTMVHELELKSMNHYTDAGIYIFRNKHANEKMDYLAVMSSKKRIAHGHLDQGSFVLYKESVPVVVDTGIQGYFNSSTPWHKSSYSHACMLFASEKVEKEKLEGFINLSVGNFTREHGFYDTPLFSKVITSDVGGEQEKLQIEVSHVCEKGRQIRTFVVDKKERTWTICDKVEEYEGEVMFILPLMAQSLDIDGNEIHMKGYYGVEMDISIGSKFQKIEVENGQTMPVYPSDEKVQYLKYVRIYADSKDGFLVKMM